MNAVPINTVDTTRFIGEIQAREPIWNLGSPLYHSRKLRWNAWVEVYTALNGSGFDELSTAEKKKRIDDLQKKWKNIRDHFRKNRKAQPPGLLSSSKSVKPYIYSDMLDFLIPVIENKKSHNNIENDESDSYEEENTSDSLTASLDCVKKELPVVEKCIPPPKKRTKKNNGTETMKLLEDKTTKPSSSKVEEDPDKLFLLSLLPQIRQLNADQKNYLYIEFLQTIQRAKFWMNPTYNHNASLQQFYKSSNNFLYQDPRTLPLSIYNMLGASNVFSGFANRASSTTGQFTLPESTTSTPTASSTDLPSPSESMNSI